MSSIGGGVKAIGRQLALVATQRPFSSFIRPEMRPSVMACVTKASEHPAGCMRIALMGSSPSPLAPLRSARMRAVRFSQSSQLVADRDPHRCNKGSCSGSWRAARSAA